MTIVAPSTVVGVLYGGELGSSLGRLLADGGVSVVTTVKDRSQRTRKLANDANLRILPTFRDVVEASDIILSVVAPSAALPVARRVTEAARGKNARLSVFVDVNSISPHTARQIEAIVVEEHIEFCDAAVQGLASKLRMQGTLFLSGSGVAAVAPLFAGALRTRDLGKEAGRASLMKMLLGGFSKSLVASFLMLALLSRSSSILDDFLAASRTQYPEIMAVIERLLPTYPQHAARRAEEMAELAETLRRALVPAWFAEAAQEAFAQLAGSGLREQWLAANQGCDSSDGDDIVRRLVELVHCLATFGQQEAVHPVAAHHDVA